MPRPLPAADLVDGVVVEPRNCTPGPLLYLAFAAGPS
jgi:hypothetical protein